MASVWTRLRDAVDPVTRRLFGLYAAYPLTAEEHIGGAGMTRDDARYWLRQNGYEPQYLSAAKKHPSTGALHDLSYRRVPSVKPPEAAGRRIAAWGPEHTQYHVHVFVGGGRAEFYSHYELRPDFFRPRLDPERLRIHYRPLYGEDYLRGVTDLSL